MKIMKYDTLHTLLPSIYIDVCGIIFDNYLNYFCKCLFYLLIGLPIIELRVFSKEKNSAL
jgi:hypothetical protein